ncbi:Ig-like domain-containing protein [Sodalis ligni]|uniref:Ig-like domain-containing protein n=1 Tax=Sodalis ligni TaxID=2697027 RepID=UPI00193ECEA3|nr:Ig-like domain-containing protein [Sodalis ligni]QWA10758.1 Ig-like domain-containing protein [Sodalis ligni]
MQEKPCSDEETFPEEEPLADYSLTLAVTSGALANGIATNAATATLKSGNNYLAQRTINFELTGSARFTTNNLQRDSVNTNSLGNATITFINSLPQEVTVYSSFTPLNGEEILARKNSTFEDAASPVLILNSRVDQNNAYADGILPNTIIYTVQNSAGQPVSGVLINFTRLSGEANLIPAVDSRTDSQGMLTLYMYTLTPGPVSVRAYIADQPDIYKDDNVNFRSNDILIVSVENDFVPANGTTPAQLLYLLLNSRNQPVRDAQLEFRATCNAMLPSSGYTDNNGQYLLNVTNFYPERVTVTCYLIADPSVNIHTDVTFVPS